MSCFQTFRPSAVVLITLLWLSSANASDLYHGGFVQGLYGGGLDNGNPTVSELTASETRLQLRLESYSDRAEFFGRLDFVYDDYDQQNLDWELREGYAKFRLGGKIDLKIGRQIITWGTGDLLFINDLFAKDYRSFFIGRDDQYLKAPHNAIRVEYYSPIGVLTGVHTFRFTPNVVPTGGRLSYFSPFDGRIVGGNEHVLETVMPTARLKNSEIAARFSRYVGEADVALYFYHGFYKNPVGIDMAAAALYYPRLNAYGASLRLPLLGGIAWIESGYYDSRDDRCGGDPTVPNSSVSTLIGFERQIMTNLTANVQYQNETMVDYDTYTANLSQQMIQLDEVYHLVTSRITKLLRMETVNLSIFVFYSPSDEDFYGRFSIAYKYTDALTLAAGANLFDGSHNYTDFGALNKNDNVYVKVTYGY